ncbi:hypothetical protein IL306_001195 [Fusarium sp. DS 682]|nr:hypothetical protein IL306_001195 [Fusarium sp. DS 682]
MAAVSKIMTVVLRIAQLICAVIIVGIASDYIAAHQSRGLGHLSRFIFTVAVAVVSAFFAFIWLIPFSSNYMNCHIDAIMAIFSGAMAGWLIYSSEKQCGEFEMADVKATQKWDDNTADLCTKWKALYVFTLIAAVSWLISAAVGYFWLRKNKKAVKAQYKPATGGRRRHR